MKISYAITVCNEHKEIQKLLDQNIQRYKPDIIFSCWEHDTHQDHKN